MRSILLYMRFVPIVIFAFIFNDNKRLRMDVDRWIKPQNMESFYKRLAVLLHTKKEFRNLFIHRNKFPRNHKFFCAWIKLWYPPEPTLYLECSDIGGGLFIQHGFSSYISPEKMGDNCWINQQVTIGYNGGLKAPRIGNNVMITCGAKVLGDIEIGDNTRVGANAVVLRDYKRGNGILVGVPAVPKKEASEESLR